MVLIGDRGGSGTFYHLRAVINQDGKLMDVAGVLLGDRVKLESVTIADGVITVDMIKHSPDDPMVSPSLKVADHYKLQKDQLVKQ
ncbi:hypothetical protein ACFL6S_21165 [Candidatus Poribacteria bacterium]